jgi:hypothetical protein
MTEVDLQRVEGAYGRQFPVAVRDFFLNFPPEFRAAAENRDPDDAEFRLNDNADHLIQAITRGRSYLIPPDWAPHMLLLGCGGCGETYWVDLDDERGPVLLFDQGEPAEFSYEVAGSLQEYAWRLLGPGSAS